MSDPKEQQRESDDLELELEPEAIQDLDVPGDDADEIRGGCKTTAPGAGCCAVTAGAF